jgi:hypothetical protein
MLEAHKDKPLRNFITAIRSVDSFYISSYQISVDKRKLKRKPLLTLQKTIGLFHQNLIRFRLTGKSASHTTFATF